METYNWNIIKEKVENALFRLEVSHDSTNVQPEIESFVIDKLNKLNKERNNSSTIEYIKITKNIIFCLDIYSSYIIGFHKYEEQHYKNLYQIKIRELDYIIITEYTKLKEKFRSTSGVEKIGYGDCLVDAALLYIKLSKEIWQQPSPEYHSKYADVVKTLNEIKELNTKIIKKIYDLSKAEQTLIKISTLQDSSLKLDDDSMNIILNSFEQKEYIIRKKEKIKLTEKGQKFINEFLESPNKENITNITQIFGDLYQSQIQQNTSDSNQNIKSEE